MDVYRQAAEIVRIVRDGRGTAKALCLRKEMQKKKQTYAVVCETLRHYELIEDILNLSEFYQYYPHAKKDIAMCLTYDCVIGRGINTKSDSTALAVQKCGPYLREAYEKCRKHHSIAPRQKTDEEWDDTEDGAAPVRLPRYARVNTLKIDSETLIERLRRPKRARVEDENSSNRRTRAALPSFTVDAHVPDLLVFPHGTDLHNHPSVKGSQLILQDKSSCLPACVLLDAVPCEVMAERRKEGKKTTKTNAETTRRPLEFVLDACAAPGNKTTQLAALGAGHDIKLLAVERDAKRSAILAQRVQTLSASKYINVVNQDFFDLSSDVRDVVEGILLDPSCSASGVVSRVDINIKQHQQFLAKGKHSAADGEVDDMHPQDDDGTTSAVGDGSRVEKLSQVQRKLLTHALLSFPLCRTIVYSTCSVHEAENEGVVRTVLEDERVQKKGWTLTNIMPKTWRTRGRSSSSTALPLHYTIRCDPAADQTNGFYVARFDRSVPEAAVSADVAASEEGDVKGAKSTTTGDTQSSVTAKTVDEALVALRKTVPKKMEFSSDEDDE